RLHADVVAEEDLPVLRRAVQQHLQPLREVADDRVEVHEEVLDPAVDQLVLRGVHDHRRVEDSLAARIQNGIQVGHPFWVGGHLYGHRVSSQGARAMEKRVLARAPNVAPRLTCTSSCGLTTCASRAGMAVSVVTASRSSPVDTIYRLAISSRSIA